MQLEMPIPVDNTRQNAVNSRTPAGPSVAIRNKQGPYVTPRLANAKPPKASPSPELSRSKPKVANGTGPRLQDTKVTSPAPNLNTNVTPRSGSRNARVNSATSTPSSTPNSSRQNSRPTSAYVARDRSYSIGTKGLGLTNLSPRAPQLADNVTTQRASKRLSGDRKFPLLSSPTDTSKFFHIDDRKVPALNQNTGNRVVGKKQGFVYANGDEDNSIPERVSRPPSELSHTSEARGAVRTGSPSRDNPIKAGVTSPRSPTATAGRRQQPETLPRSGSPLKEFDLATAPNLANGSVTAASKGSTRKRLSSGLYSSISSGSRARMSVGTSTTGVSGGAAVETSSDINEGQDLQAQTQPNLKTGPYDSLVSLRLETKQQSLVTKSPESLLGSPTKLHNRANSVADSHTDPAPSAAADARRERKILDLEISNSSLLAINRTLEREMRKQKADLRRYRRLKSSGRISNISGVDLSSNRLSGDSRDHGADSSQEEDGNDDLLSTGSSGGGGRSSLSSPISVSMRPSTAGDTRRSRGHRADEERLRLDLLKHQELLIDSQRLNQSLKRCLGWTDELIKEGRKALVYRVRPSDIELGGRVLEDGDGELDADHGKGQGLLSPMREHFPAGWEGRSRSSSAGDPNGYFGIMGSPGEKLEDG